MRIAFITPTLHTLGKNWEKDPQIVKLAAPTLSGFLYSRGYTDIRQYDFEVELFQIEANQPDALDLQAFFDDDAVDRYLAGNNDELGEQVRFIVDSFEIAEADLFAFSCASVLEIYADMHAAGNINMAMCKELKRRFPNCKTMVGGLQMSPDSLHAAEYTSMLERCEYLDFAAEGAGEGAMWAVLEHLEGTKVLAPDGKLVIQTDGGIFIRRIHSKPSSIPKSILREEKMLGRLPKIFETPDDAPAGDHDRTPLINPSIQDTPYFDLRNIQRRKQTGRTLLERYHLDDSWGERLKDHLDKEVVLIPQIFQEGCNARCAFCSYSMTTMAKREIDEVVRGLAWIKETYGVKYFHFLNTNINGSMKYAEAFCDALIEADLGIYWSDCANLWALNERLMDKLKASGCVRLTFGLECPSPRMLKYILKGIDVETAHQRLQYLDKLGIWNHLLLITGLPTETTEDTKHFIDFLERSKDYVHGYSISSFYLITSSLMGAFPERFGLEMLPNPSGLLEDSAFNEKDGLTWEEKKVQIVESTKIITETIRNLKTDPKYISGSIDLELLFWLYDSLGHENKAEIVRAYEEAYLGAPEHAKYYEKNIHKLLTEPTGPVGSALSQSGLTPRLDALTPLGTSSLVVPFMAGTSQIEMAFEIKDRCQDGAFASGHQLQLSRLDSPTCTSTVAHAVAPGSKLDKALQSAGWQISKRTLGDGSENAGFQIADGDARINITFTLASADTPAFRRRDNVAMSYRVPHGATDVTHEPRVIKIMQLAGDYVLSRLVAKLKGAEEIDAGACQKLAQTLIDELEAPHLNWANRELPEHGQRYGNKFSRVAPDRGY